MSWKRGSVSSIICVGADDRPPENVDGERLNPDLQIDELADTLRDVGVLEPPPSAAVASRSPIFGCSDSELNS